MFTDSAFRLTIAEPIFEFSKIGVWNMCSDIPNQMKVGFAL
jgi:hypothetical protein